MYRAQGFRARQKAEPPFQAFPPSELDAYSVKSMGDLLRRPSVGTEKCDGPWPYSRDTPGAESRRVTLWAWESRFIKQAVSPTVS